MTLIPCSPEIKLLIHLPIPLWLPYILNPTVSCSSSVAAGSYSILGFSNDLGLPLFFSVILVGGLFEEYLKSLTFSDCIPQFQASYHSLTPDTGQDKWQMTTDVYKLGVHCPALPVCRHPLLFVSVYSSILLTQLDFPLGLKHVYGDVLSLFLFVAYPWTHIHAYLSYPKSRTYLYFQCSHFGRMASSPPFFSIDYGTFSRNRSKQRVFFPLFIPSTFVMDEYMLGERFFTFKSKFVAQRMSWFIGKLFKHLSLYYSIFFLNSGTIIIYL